jgi:diguanylate cyclase (GGDEF)-like protein
LLEVIRIQTEIVKTGIDLGGLIALVAERVQALTGASGVVVELAEADEMVYRAAAGLAENQLGLRLKRQGSLSGLCLAQRQIMVCEDSETDPRVDRAACRKVGLRSMVVVPLNYLDTTVGVLKVMSPTPGAFDQTVVDVLALMSELIAAAMFQATRLGADQLYYRATHDCLTGLANRALFFDRLRQYVTSVERDKHRFAIINIDMDDLKHINDQHGHRAGDAAICEVASRLSSISRKTDTVARVGGDEFGVLLARVDSRAAAQAHCHRLAEVVEQPFEFEHHPLRLGVSAGLAVCPDDGNQLDLLVEKADQAMYEAKQRRKQAAFSA